MRAAARVLPTGADLLAGPRQRLDLAGSRLPGSLRGSVDGRRIALVRLDGRLGAQAPRARLARMAQHLDTLGSRLRRAESVTANDNNRRLAGVSERLRAAFAARLRLEAEVGRSRHQRLASLDRRLAFAVEALRQRRSARLAALGQVLAGLSYRNVLSRGFALVRDRDGFMVRTTLDLPPGTALSLEFADGQVGVEVRDGVASVPRPRIRASPKPLTPAGEKQGTLF